MIAIAPWSCGDEPDHYRTYALIPACGNVAATNALADLFTAAPQLLDVLDEADIVWGEAFDSGNPVDGGDLVEWFAQWLPTGPRCHCRSAGTEGRSRRKRDARLMPSQAALKCQPWPSPRGQNDERARCATFRSGVTAANI